MSYHDFPLTAPSLNGRELFSANTHVINLDRPYVVKGLLMASQVSVFCGPPNLGKSCVAASVCAHVSMGRDLGSMKVERALVVYIAAEDAGGVLDRAHPFMKTAPADTAPFYVHDKAVDLTDKAAIEELCGDLIELARQASADRILTVFDTLNYSIGRSDENNAGDMGRAMANARLIAQTTGAHVMIIHHTGKDNQGGPRGSTAILGAADTVLVLHKADEKQPAGVVFAAQVKQRSCAKGEPAAFEIRPFHVGEDQDGDAVSVPMAIPFAPKSSLIPAPARAAASKKASPAGARRADLLRVFTELARLDGGKRHSAKDVGARTGTPFGDVRDNPDSLRVAVKRALTDLHKAGKIEGDASLGYRLARSDSAAAPDGAAD